MKITEMRYIFLLGVMIAMIAPLFLAGCISSLTPIHTTNACYVLQQKDGFFSSWQRSIKGAEKLYSIPIPILLATVYVESGFYRKAHPPRTTWFGFIPGMPMSTAYGYAQALNGTWNDYCKRTGTHGAKRTNFRDSVYFIAWYHRESVRKNKISSDDAYNLYLNYYMGHEAYATKRIPSVTAVEIARKMQDIARQYDKQLRKCGRR